MERRTVVYVGGICNRKGNVVVCEDDIKKLYKDHVDAGDVEVTMHEKNNGKAYALIYCTTAELALKAIQQLNNKHLEGKEMAVSFFHAQVDDEPMEYTIGEDIEDGYKRFINRLRDKLANHLHIHGPAEFIVEKLPVLPKQRSQKQPDRWIHIKLSAVKGGQTSRTTLVMRDDNLYVKGFQNKDGKWFELCEPDETEEEKLPVEHYKPKEAVPDWGVNYSSIMGLNNLPQTERTLASTRLGKAFAERAVRRLSSYKPSPHYNGDENPTRLGLAGLIVMICEAARMNPFLDTISGDWNRGTGLSAEHARLMQNWGNISAALLEWKRNDYGRDKWNGKCGVNDEVAKRDVFLVLNSSILRGRGAPRNLVEILSVFSNYSPVHSIKVRGDAKNEHHQIYPPEPKQGKKKRNIAERKEDKQKTKDDSSAESQTSTKDGKNEEIREEEKESTSNVHDTGKGDKEANLISGYEWFDMIVKLPDVVIERRWDCREVVNGDATELVTRTIGLDSSGHKIQVTYLVMSNAVEATVEVKLRLNGGGNLENEKGAENSVAIKKGGGSTRSASGEITAQIGGFEGHPIVLFKRVEKPITLESTLTLPLDRFTVHVPHGKQLQIDMNGLRVTETQSEVINKQLEPEPKHNSEAPPLLKLFPHQTSPKLRLLNFPFAAEESSPEIQVINGCQAEVHVTWPSLTKKPYEPEPDAVFTIGDKKFTEFISDVREAFADKDQPPIDTWRLTRLRPAQGRRDQWIHIKLRVEGLSTTLVIQDGKCYGVGFMNQSQVWYDLGHGNQRRDDNQLLPPEYNSVLLGWGLSYKDILDVSDWGNVPMKLNEAGLGKKSFAEKAVRTLSRYPDVDEDDLNLRVALAGLLIMVCESARFNPLLEYFRDNWDKDAQTGFLQKHMNYIWSWGKISQALLLCKDNQGEWPINKQTPILVEREINNECDALNAVRLVYRNARTLEFHPTPSGGSSTEELGLE